MVPASAPQRYAYSSLAVFLGKGRPAWLEAETVLQTAGELSDTRHGWTRYAQYLEFLATDEQAKRELVARRMSRGWCLGGADFKRAMTEKFQRQGADLAIERFAGLEPEELQQEREAAWEERLQAIAGAGRIGLSDLPPKKSDTRKVTLAAAMKQSTSVSNRWLAERLHMGEPASVSQFVRRWMIVPQQAKEIARIVAAAKR